LGATYEYAVMKITYIYYKNSNTGKLIVRQIFSSDYFKSPDLFYDHKKKGIGNPSLEGFVEITEKKFKREAKLWK
jgi:hypothetical protein